VRRFEDDLGSELQVERFSRAQRLEDEFDRQFYLERLARTTPGAAWESAMVSWTQPKPPGLLPQSKRVTPPTTVGMPAQPLFDAAKDGG